MMTNQAARAILRAMVARTAAVLQPWAQATQLGRAVFG